MARFVYLVFVLLLAFCAYCGFTHGQAPSPMLLVVPTVQSAEPTADGDYVKLQLPCKCGAVWVYVPASCPCFDADSYPDLDKALKAVYAMALDMSKGVKQDKAVGKYEVWTLKCGCSLRVYIPGTCGCLEKKYPKLLEVLKQVHAVASKHRDTK